jgi:hypothetical protein
MQQASSNNSLKSGCVLRHNTFTFIIAKACSHRRSLTASRPRRRGGCKQASMRALSRSAAAGIPATLTHLPLAKEGDRPVIDSLTPPPNSRGRCVAVAVSGRFGYGYGYGYGGVQTSGFRLQASGFRLQASGFRLQASGLGSSGFRLRI